MPTPAIIVHGGAGAIRLEGARLARYRAGLAAACRAGLDALPKGPLAAVEAAVRSMEASGAFNAGAGSCLNLEREAECDAAVMVGADWKCGAVGGLKGFKHPVSVARRVMEDTSHVLVVGEGAAKLARSFGSEPAQGGPTIDQLEEWRDMVAELEAAASPGDPRQAGLQRLLRSSAMAPRGGGGGGGADGRGGRRPDGDTVGAAAIDAEGRLAAACSTGGLWLKLPGRVGDSPVPGAGLYADDLSGAASATGIGETILKSCLTKLACLFMGAGRPANQACAAALDVLTRRFGAGTAGICALDRDGRPGAAFNTAAMGRGFLAAGMDAPVVAVKAEEPFPNG